MSCYHCKEGELSERPKSYTCTKCNLVIWKTISGKQIDKPLAEELFTTGRTEVLDGFISKKGRPFKASLEISSEEGKIKFNFPETNPVTKPQYMDREEIFIQLEANRSGDAIIILHGHIEQSLHIDFGLLPARLTECLALITALKIINYRAPNVTGLKISCSNLDFSRYLLQERSPRDTDARKSLDYLYGLLGNFKQWSIVYEKSKRQRLQGSSRARFPFGAFPWMKSIASAHKAEDKILVRLPDDPAVKAQFLASFWKVETVGTQSGSEIVEYKLSVKAERALKTWLATVVTQKSELLNKN